MPAAISPVIAQRAENEFVGVPCGMLDQLAGSENARVLDAAERLRVSCPELDLAVSSARSAGALGARMTGGDFGGSAIALINAGDRARVAGTVGTAFARQGLRAPRFLDAVPSAGAGMDL